LTFGSFDKKPFVADPALMALGSKRSPINVTILIHDP